MLEQHSAITGPNHSTRACLFALHRSNSALEAVGKLLVIASCWFYIAISKTGFLFLLSQVTIRLLNCLFSTFTDNNQYQPLLFTIHLRPYCPAIIFIH